MPEKIAVRLLEVLACPRCQATLELRNEKLECPSGHAYPIVDGIPVFIIPEARQTIDIALASYHAASSGKSSPPYADTLGLTEDERLAVLRLWNERKQRSPVDPVVSYMIGATSGYAYGHVKGRLDRYPVPEIPLGPGTGEALLDIGCNWGRWSVAAARAGWTAIGIDPSLGAVMAARRAFADQPNIMFVCGDARYLPFRSNSLGCVFSYSVIQHFSQEDATQVLGEVGRVLKAGGYSKIQMANRGGLRSLYVRFCHGEDSGIFRVRYWSIGQLKRVFADKIGKSVLLPEAFGGLGLLREDLPIVSLKAKLLIGISIATRAVARIVTPLIRLADSVYVVSTKR